MTSTLSLEFSKLPKRIGLKGKSQKDNVTSNNVVNGNTKTPNKPKLPRRTSKIHERKPLPNNTTPPPLSVPPLYLSVPLHVLFPLANPWTSMPYAKKEAK